MEDIIIAWIGAEEVRSRKLVRFGDSLLRFGLAPLDYFWHFILTNEIQNFVEIDLGKLNMI